MENIKPNLKDDTAKNCKQKNVTETEGQVQWQSSDVHREEPILGLFARRGKDEQRSADKTDKNAFVHSSYIRLHRNILKPCRNWKRNILHFLFKLDSEVIFFKKTLHLEPYTQTLKVNGSNVLHCRRNKQ